MLDAMHVCVCLFWIVFVDNLMIHVNTDEFVFIVYLLVMCMCMFMFMFMFTHLYTCLTGSSASLSNI